MDSPRSSTLFFVDVHQDAAIGLVDAPPGRRVGFAQRGDVARPPVDRRQPVQMTAVLGGERGDEMRAPARMKAVIDVQRAEAAEACVDQPQLIVVVPRHFVDVDVAGDMNAARQATGVVLAGRIEPGGDRRHVAVFPDGPGAADGQAVVADGDAHGFVEVTEMRVDGVACGRTAGEAVIAANENHLAGLVGRYHEADVQLPEDIRQAGREYAAQRLIVPVSRGGNHSTKSGSLPAMA